MATAKPNGMVNWSPEGWHPAGRSAKSAAPAKGYRCFADWQEQIHHFATAQVQSLSRPRPVYEECMRMYECKSTLWVLCSPHANYSGCVSVPPQLGRLSVHYRRLYGRGLFWLFLNTSWQIKTMCLQNLAGKRQTTLSQMSLASKQSIYHHCMIFFWSCFEHTVMRDFWHTWKGPFARSSHREGLQLASSVSVKSSIWWFVFVQLTPWWPPH